MAGLIHFYQMQKEQIEIVVFEGEEMTDAEVESVAALLLSWWRRDFESRGETGVSGITPYPVVTSIKKGGSGDAEVCIPAQIRKKKKST